MKMARLAATAAALAILFVAASATYRTTITTVEFDDEANPGHRGSGGSSQQCRRGSSRQQLRQCEQYITQGRGFIVLPRHEGSQESLQQCCQQLRQIDQQCRCEGLRQIVQEQQQQGELQGQELREVVQRAQNLPNMCRLGPQQCDISPYGGGY